MNASAFEVSRETHLPEQLCVYHECDLRSDVFNRLGGSLSDTKLYKHFKKGIKSNNTTCRYTLCIWSCFVWTNLTN